jgi:UDP-N-acetylmuramoyl-tripeptide--D-alanyl-D-alanine ligase
MFSIIRRTTYTRDGEVSKLGLANAIGYRIRDLFGDDLIDRCFVRMARRWRPILKKPVFIGVAGSLGKTTTKELLVGVLRHRWRGTGNRGSFNIVHQVAKTILRVRPKDDFCVVELSEDAPGLIDEPLSLLRPSIGIVTVIGKDHWSAFNSREGIAKEVGKLIASLPATGTAVLNADDELVLAMRANCNAKVITYGTSPAAELRAENISATWPDRLEMTIAWGTERVPVRTQLCASHWVPSVLGAMGAGLARGMSLAECAEGIASVAPFDGRMQPVTTPEGVTFIRDDFKASLGTVDACFEFMKAARAKRKIIVIGTLSDCGARESIKYMKVAKRAQEIAEITIFVGAWAPSVLKARKPGGENALRVFSHVRDAAEYINSITREGDLVLLKGAIKQDHLLRIIMARTGDIACWREDCERFSFCNECPERNKPSGLPALLGSASISGAAPKVMPTGGRAVESDEQIIIGLGNPESKYGGTPHNIGYEAVDRIASTLALAWDSTPEAWIARGSSHGRSICLVKIKMAMNLTGVGLKRLSENMAFGPEQCILVHDDLDTPIGSVRTRLSGGAGGHRGVASILEAFQTDAFRRVKIGVGQGEAKLKRVEYVLTAFNAASRVAADLAIPIAEARALEMVERPSMTKRQ